jgi:formylglycine-generating enzyme required for sulfatase activity
VQSWRRTIWQIRALTKNAEPILSYWSMLFSFLGLPPMRPWILDASPCSPSSSRRSRQLMTSPIQRASQISNLVAAMFIGAAGEVALADETAQSAKTTTQPSPTHASTASPAIAPAALRRNHVIPDLELELIWVEPGTFVMGSPSHEPERNKAEGPETRVILTQGFWLGKTEVTQAQYEAIAGENPSTFKSAGPNAPVERVSWIDALNFCRKLTERERGAGRLPEGYAYTLPTEAQWEYAHRAGSTGAYSGEPEVSSWNKSNSGETTHPVGTKRPNAWGFHDMAGNVAEWCLDWYGSYPGGEVVDPTGPERGYYRMARGGSWRTDARLGRAAARSGGSEGRLDYTMGFRIALSPARNRDVKVH